MARDDFLESTKNILRRRVSETCSNPDCSVSTGGPSETPSKVSSIGEAAHIEGAAKNSPRYNKSMSSEKRRHINNALWLCSNCHTKIDNDSQYYTVELLKEWKVIAEEKARNNQGAKNMEKKVINYNFNASINNSQFNLADGVQNNTITSSSETIEGLFRTSKYEEVKNLFHVTKIKDETDYLYFIISSISRVKISSISTSEIEKLYSFISMLKKGEFSHISEYLWLILFYENSMKFTVGRELDNQEKILRLHALSHKLNTFERNLLSNIQLETQEAQFLTL